HAVHARLHRRRRPDPSSLAPGPTPRRLGLPPRLLRSLEQPINLPLHGQDFVRLEHAPRQHIPGVTIEVDDEQATQGLELAARYTYDWNITAPGAASGRDRCVRSR